MHLTIAKKIQQNTDLVEHPQFPATLQHIYSAVSKDALNDKEARRLVASIILDYFHYLRKADENLDLFTLPGLGDDLLHEINNCSDRLMCPSCGYVMSDSLWRNFETIRDERKVVACKKCRKEYIRLALKQAWRAEGRHAVKRFKSAAKAWDCG